MLNVQYSVEGRKVESLLERGLILQTFKSHKYQGRLIDGESNTA